MAAHRAERRRGGIVAALRDGTVGTAETKKARIRPTLSVLFSFDRSPNRKRFHTGTYFHGSPYPKRVQNSVFYRGDLSKEIEQTWCPNRHFYDSVLGWTLCIVKTNFF